LALSAWPSIESNRPIENLLHSSYKHIDDTVVAKSSFAFIVLCYSSYYENNLTVWAPYMFEHQIALCLVSRLLMPLTVSPIWFTSLDFPKDCTARTSRGGVDIHDRKRKRVCMVNLMLRSLFTQEVRPGYSMDTDRVGLQCYTGHCGETIPHALHGLCRGCQVTVTSCYVHPSDGSSNCVPSFQ